MNLPPRGAANGILRYGLDRGTNGLSSKHSNDRARSSRIILTFTSHCPKLVEEKQGAALLLHRLIGCHTMTSYLATCTCSTGCSSLPPDGRQVTSRRKIRCNTLTSPHLLMAQCLTSLSCTHFWVRTQSISLLCKQSGFDLFVGSSEPLPGAPKPMYLSYRSRRTGTTA